jgi:signal transduction histidine kinase
VASIENAIETVRLDAQSKDIKIEVTSPEDALFVHADPVRLEQIIWNLLNNSVKFTPKGGRIAVCLEDDADQAVLTISDNGQGIDSSFLPQIFEIFRQADSGTSRAQAGMGIGLAVVQQLVELHGGQGSNLYNSTPANHGNEIDVSA